MTTKKKAKKTGDELTQSTPEAFVVRGEVRDADGSPVVGAIVRAFDKDLRSEEMLGEATTDKDGRYEITYTATKFQRTEKKSADLIVRVLSKKGQELVSSKIIFNAKPVETVGLVIGGGEYRGPSEFERLVTELTPVLQGTSLADLKEDKDDQDFTFLSGETGQNRRHIELLSLAARLSQETADLKTKLEPEVLYGLLRQNLPTKLTALLSQHQKVLAGAVAASLRDNIISLKWKGETGSILSSLKKLRIQKAMESGEDGKPSLGQLLAESSLPAGKHREFLELYVEHDGRMETFLEKLKDNNDFKDHIADLRLTFELKALTRNHLAMLHELKRRGTKSVRDLADLDEAGWTRLITKKVNGKPIGFPPDTHGEEDEKVSNYARSLAQTIEKAFPTAVIASRVTKAARPAERDLVQFLKNNNPHFEFGSTHIDSFLAGPDGEAALAGINDREALTRELKRWQRVFNVTARYEEMRVLMERGINSAFQIAGKGQANFEREFGRLLGERTTKILAAANHRAAMAQNVYGQFASWSNFPVHVIPQPPSQLENFANWAALFGSLSFCECEHCRSVLSPAAYLVDLLHFFREKGLRLSKIVNGQQTERLAIDVLRERRPDIEEIQLSCANTNTLVPYIDLVNEILENAIRPIAGTLQTNGTEQELEVNPEHVNIDAYEELADAIYPWSLPFDLWATEIRTYLEHLGIPRHELMSVFQREGSDGAQSAPTAIEIASARLGLTNRERDIITGAAPESARQFWGYAEGDEWWVGDILNVVRFLQRSALSYQELLELLSLRYIRNNAAIAIAFTTPCNLEGAVIDASLAEEGLGRAHRFLRLQRKLGWTMRELDQTITAIEPGSLNDDFLLKLSFIKTLRQELNVPLVNMLAWWGRRVDTTRYRIQGQPETPTLYSRLFLNKAVMNPDDASFTLDATGEIPHPPAPEPPPTISSHIPAIAAALGITEAEVSLLTSAVDTLQLLNLPASEVPNDDLSVQNLSHLYRVVSFSKALRLSLRDLLALKALTGIRALTSVSPFQAASPEDTVRFVEVVRKVRSSPFSIAELDYLLRHVDQTSRSARPTEQQVALILTEIADGLDKIAAETTFETTIVPRNNVQVTIGLVPAGGLLRDKLAILLPAATVDAVLQFVEKKPGVPDLQAQALIRAHFGVFLDVESAVTSLVGANATIQDLEARIAYVLIPLMSHLRQVLSERLVTHKLATALRLENAAMDALLTQFVRSPSDGALRAIDEFLLRAAADDPAAAAERFRRQFAAYIRLHKIAMVVAGLAIRTNELRWLFTRGAEVGWLRLADLPTALTPRDELAGAFDTWKERFSGWLRLRDMYSLLQTLPALRDPLTADDWRRLAVDFNRTDRLDAQAPALFNLFSFAGSFDQANWGVLSRDAFLSVLASRTGWSTADLLLLAGGEDGLNFSWPAAAGDELAPIRIERCFAVAKRLGVSVAHLLLDWRRADVSWPEAGEIAASIKRTARAKYADDQWPAVAKPIRDTLREQQRAALVSYLTSHPDHVGRTFQDTNDLFNHFLIDVEMSTCMPTSRIVQATCSVQLFIQRCLMNLEEAGAPLAGEDWGTYWRWMKSYRVWEANRKVFLYPENWIEPELRDGKSPFFTALESDLLQKDMTTATAEAAFSGYLEKLDEVARLEIVGLYQEMRTSSAEHPVLSAGSSEADAIRELQEKLNAASPEPVVGESGIFEDNTRLAVTTFQTAHGIPADGVVGSDTWAALDQITGAGVPRAQPRNVLHVIGRTRNDPHIYFYRRRVEAVWTPWERVDLDIEGPHVMPVVWNDRLYLFWPMFSEIAAEPVLEDQDDGPSEAAPEKYWEIQIAWSEYKENKWTAKTVSAERVNRSIHWDDEWIRVAHHPRQDFFFKVWVPQSPFPPDSNPLVEANSLVVDCFLWLRNESEHLRLASFWLTRPHGVPQTRAIALLTSNEDPEDQFLAEYLRPSHTHVKFMAFAEYRRALDAPYDENADSLTIVSGDVDPSGNLVPGTDQEVPVLDRTPGLFEIAYPHQFLQFVCQTPFFYQDDSRTFFVTIPIRGEGGFLVDGELVEGQTIYPRFQTFYHPYASDFVGQVVQFGIEGLLDPGGRGFENWRFRHQLNRRDFFQPEYLPVLGVGTGAVLRPYPVEDIDVSEQGAYALYNWELFFHAPLLIADRLSTNQRFEEAQKWFHYIFDPTERSNEPGTRRYWKFRKFYEDARFYDRAQENPPTVEELMANMPELEEQIDQWRKHPFNPHLIARMRTTAYQKTVVMKYIANLIAWGDQLFRRDTRESINEATLLYILAAQILGERPQKLPADDVGSRSYAQLEPDLDAFSNALLESESFLVAAGGGGPRFDVDEQGNEFLGEGAFGEGGGPRDLRVEVVPVLSSTLYFCIPPNEKLLECWDTVANRLLKIRCCMNIEGVVRLPPLFEPPIDPALLVGAEAAGVDISSALSDVNAGLPHYRFSVMTQKATDLCNDVKALGATLLSAIEKRDAEELAMIRAAQETQILGLIEQVKIDQVEEATDNEEGLVKARDVAWERYKHYQKLLGNKEQQKPAIGEAVPEYTFSSNVTTVETGGVKATSYEKNELERLEAANLAQNQAGAREMYANIAHVFPDLSVSIAPWGMGSSTTFGGSNIGAASSSFASFYRNRSAQAGYEASSASRMGSLALREQEWGLQVNLAAREMMQVDRQIAAAKLRGSIADKELQNHRKQIENARTVESFMREKYSNQELYQWQVGQISGVYFQSYRLAYDLAKRAERCFRFELGLQDSSYITFGYWDSLKKGLLSGEKLQYDLRRLETAYLEENRREFELTKHISLVLLDPLALVTLRETGRCFFHLPEEIFDLDYPGHYFRRIKSVSLTLPCVVGPYTTISCTLRLMKNSIRINTTDGDNGYPRNTSPANDSRFIENNIPVKAIAASNAQNDSGVFELSFRDERYLPFEGAGAVSDWSLELFNDDNDDFGKPLRQFDYGTISDAILHVKYTAREDAGTFKHDAVTHLRNYFSQDGATPSMRLFNLQHEFPTQWHRFLNPTNPDDGNVFELEMTPLLFPMRDLGKTLNVNTIWLLARCTRAESYNVVMTPPLPAPPPPDSNTITLTRDPQYGGLHLGQKGGEGVAALGIRIVPTNQPTWRIRITRPGGGNLIEDPVEVEDVILVLGYEWQ